MTFSFSFQDWYFLLERFFYIINSILQSTLLFYFLPSLSSYSIQHCGILGLQSSYWKLCSCLKNTSVLIILLLIFFSYLLSILCSGGSIIIYINPLGGHLIIPHWCHQEGFGFFCGLGQRKCCQKTLSFITSFLQENSWAECIHITKVLMVSEFSWIFISDYSDGFRPLYCLWGLFEMLSILCHRTWLADNQLAVPKLQLKPEAVKWPHSLFLSR